MKSRLTKTKIIEGARRLFQLYGFSRISMDEIAVNIKVSKKTIYNYFPTKDDLILAVIETTMRQTISAMITAIEKKDKFQDKIKNVFGIIQTITSMVTPPMIQDMENLPHIWSKADLLRKQLISKVLQKLIRNGQKSGYVRRDIEPDLLTKLYITLISAFLNPSSVSSLEMPLGEFIEKLMSIIITGIATEKGRKTLEKIK